MNKIVLNSKKFNLNNINTQILLFVIPVAYHHIYGELFDFSSYFEYVGLPDVISFLTYIYFILTLCCLFSTVTLAFKEPKNIWKFMDYPIRAVSLFLNAVRLLINDKFFMWHNSETVFDKIVPEPIIAIDNFVSSIPYLEEIIFIAGVISLLRIIVSLFMSHWAGNKTENLIKVNTLSKIFLCILCLVIVLCVCMSTETY